MKFNEQQTQAIKNSYETDIVLMAGAGSGKTSVLVNRIAYILDNELATADELLVLTFTKKASNEMCERLTKMGYDVSKMCCGTFHSVFTKFLRKYGNLIGTNKSSFTIMEDKDAKSIIKKILDANDMKYDAEEIPYFKKCISSFKNSLISPDKAVKIAKSSKDDYQIKIAKIYKAYHAFCWQTNRFDFDDLLVYQYVLMSENEDIKEKFKEMFKYILVDEAQDCNKAQIVILQLFKSDCNNLMLIGDTDQSIYAFRGAWPDFMVRHKDYFNNSRLMLLEQNYRSTSNIINASNSVIKNNLNRVDKNVFTTREKGDLVDIIRYRTDDDEAISVVTSINKLVKNNGYKYKDIVILYRNRFLSRTFEEALNKRSIPYKITGSVRFWEKKEIADILSFYKLIANPKDIKSFKRVLKLFKGIGDTKVDGMISYAKELKVDLIEVLRYCNPDKKEYSKFPSLYYILTTYKNDIGKLAEEIIDLLELLQKYTKINADWARENLEYIQEFLSIAKKNTDLSVVDFLDNIILSNTVDEKVNDCVNLMTIHMSKGLEFPIVFIVGCEDGILPSAMANNVVQLEEERRLMYVAMTRAKDKLFITNCLERQNRYFRESKFIQEIDSKYINKNNL